MKGKGSKSKETVSRQSAAEFFSEHQQIAGFDNPAKSLFTTIREFVENSLDASESVSILPNIEVTVVEFSEEEHNQRHGIDKGAKNKIETSEIDVVDDDKGKGNKKKIELKGKEHKYYHVTCKDNGCGISPENVGEMLGRVLSGSKHGIRQTRGKYGLGAKMALIWSKKSSGLPITIRTAHSVSATTVPTHITTIVLDIDIYKNEPKVLSRKNEPNKAGWRGLEISLTILGNWSNSRSKVLQYFQQLAVITPYAHFRLTFNCERDDKKTFETEFIRRSDQMPAPAAEVKYHPRSLNNITLANLLSETKADNMVKFLTHDLYGVAQPLALKIATTIGIATTKPSTLPASKIAALLQMLRDEKQIKAPSPSSLSPAGEYNIRLGVLKELQPKLVATFAEKPGAHEGHAFIVEAAVSVGGTRMREGINIFRFANRIPLLFETGADVVTQVANKRINWSSYHLDPRKDNIGVYVSIVSTRIPFKGTSKEYIGDDVLDMQQAVRRALQGCCQQLRASLAQSLARKEEYERKRTLTKYIPDISRALVSVLKKVADKEFSAAAGGGASGSSAGRGAGRGSISISTSTSSTSNDGAILPYEGTKKRSLMLADVSRGILSEDSLAAKLTQGVSALEAQCALQAASEATGTGLSSSGSGSSGSGGGGGGAVSSKRMCLYLTPTLPVSTPVPIVVEETTLSEAVEIVDCDSSTGIGSSGIGSGLLGGGEDELIVYHDDGTMTFSRSSTLTSVSSTGKLGSSLSCSQDSSVGSYKMMSSQSSQESKISVSSSLRKRKSVGGSCEGVSGRWIALAGSLKGFIFVDSVK